MQQEPTKGQSGDLAPDFWDNFQILPWRWVEFIFRKPWYFASFLILSYIYFFAISVADTSHPDVPYHERVVFLRDYASVHILLIGWFIILLLIARWVSKTPLFLQWLGTQERVQGRDGQKAVSYWRFLTDLQRDLRAPSPSIPLGFALFVFGITAIYLVRLFPFLDSWFEASTALGLKFVLSSLSCVSLFLIGQIAGAFVIMSKYVAKLTDYFILDIQPTHPDRCGGISRIGDFVLDGAIPIVAGGFVLALVSSLKLDRLDEVLYTFSVVFLYTFVLPISFFTVFRSVRGIHRDMVQSRELHQDSFANQSGELATLITIHTTQEGDLAKAAEAKEKLEILNVLEVTMRKYPVWPFRLGYTIIGLVTPQIAEFLFGFIVDQITKVEIN